MDIKRALLFLTALLCFCTSVSSANFSMSSYEIKGSILGTGSISFAGLAWSSGNDIPGISTEMRFATVTFLTPYIAHIAPIMLNLEFPVHGYEILKRRMGYKVIDPMLSLYIRLGYGEYSSSFSENLDSRGWVMDPGISFKKRTDILENVSLGLSAGYRFFTGTENGSNEQHFYVESFITSDSPLGDKTPNASSLIGISSFVGYRFLPFIDGFNSSFGKDNSVEIQKNMLMLKSAISMENDRFFSSIALSKPVNSDKLNIYFSDLIFGYFLYDNEQLSIKPSIGVNFSWLESIYNQSGEYVFSSSIWPGISAGSDFRYKIFSFNKIDITAKAGVVLKYSNIPENKAKNQFRQILTVPNIDLSGVGLHGGLTFLF